MRGERSVVKGEPERARWCVPVHRSPFGVHLLVVLLLIPVAVQAQRDTLSRAIDLERRGNFAQAADLYRAVLVSRPADLSALLGLERALTPLNRLPEILPVVRAGLEASPGSAPLYGLALRGYAAANQMDSVPRLVEQWSRITPGDESPYREWGAVALERRDIAAARRAYQAGRERTGKPDVLAPEIAQLAVIDQDWITAVREWHRAVKQLPGYRGTAVASLAQAGSTARPEILRQLDREGGPEALRLSVELRARWGDPLGAIKTFLAALPTGLPAQLDALQQLLEQVRTDTSQPFQLAQAMVLEALAERVTAPAQRARHRLDAARAYVAGGDRASARRMLTAIAGDASSAPPIAAGATATLIDLLVQEGQVAEAARRLEEFRGSLGVDDYQSLRRAVAGGYARNGDLARADALLEADSSVDATALRGRFRLYAGNLKEAVEALKSAGPFSGSREEATSRTALLAVLQPIEEDSLPPLGEAFRLADRGDSAAAARKFEEVAKELPAGHGGSQLRLVAGLLLSRHSPAESERLLREAMTPEAPGPAAAASLELGRLLLDVGRRDEAMEALETMILTYPGSALLPQARRLLDQARNAVPRT
jgi:tetratricopeptide (TPR) repeat protein